MGFFYNFESIAEQLLLNGICCFHNATWLIRIHTQTFNKPVVSFQTWQRVLLSQGFQGAKKDFHNIRGQQRQYAEPEQTLHKRNYIRMHPVQELSEL